MRGIILFLILSFAFPALAQPGIAKVVESNGQEYYQHKVEKGNTLWGIHKMYNVSVERIAQDNPSISEGLKEGQIILVYKEKSQADSKELTSEYKVKSNETLYGLSKKFNTSIDHLIALNPELKDGLIKGQIILVPSDLWVEKVEKVDHVTSPNPFTLDTLEKDGGLQKVLVSFSDSTINHVVLAHETMYSISKRFMASISDIMRLNGLNKSTVKEGQVLIIPIKNERVERVEIKPVAGIYNPEGKDSLVFEKKEEYNISILLPLNLEYGAGYSEYISGLATQYYMGAILALEELEKIGLRAKVRFFDTKNDSATVAKILSKEEFKNTDLIFGPLLAKSMTEVADYCKMNKIRMVCPVSTSTNILKDNRLVYTSVSSDITLMEELAKYMLLHNAKDNIVLIKPLDKQSLPMYEAFRKVFKEYEISHSRPNLIESSVEGFNTYIRRGVNTCLVVPSNDRKTASKFMNNLNRSAFRSSANHLFVYGTKEWINHTDINEAYKNKYNFRYPNSNHLDYYSEAMIELNKEFRSRYKTDMSKMAVQAFDVTMFFSSSFFLENQSTELIMNHFKMTQISPFDGYENSNLFLIEQEEFELLNAEFLDKK